jgi:hypothetical protein
VEISGGPPSRVSRDSGKVTAGSSALGRNRKRAGAAASTATIDTRLAGRASGGITSVPGLAHPHRGWQEGPGPAVRRPSGPGPGRRPMHHDPRRRRHHQQSLRALMTGLLGGANYSLNQASYDLARLSRNGLNTFRGTRTTAKVSAAKGLSAPYARPAQQPSARPAGGQLARPI